MQDPIPPLPEPSAVPAHRSQTGSAMSSQLPSEEGRRPEGQTTGPHVYWGDERTSGGTPEKGTKLLEQERAGQTETETAWWGGGGTLH